MIENVSAIVGVAKNSATRKTIFDFIGPPDLGCSIALPMPQRMTQSSTG
jgi:hypothetical protein